MQRECRSIESLLDLHGSIIDQGDGYWIKLEAWRVEASPKVPHCHKHRHDRDKGRPYEFKDAYELLADFFEDVDGVLHEVKSK
jgi:hypothetical protein